MSDMYEIFVFSASSHTAIIKNRSNVQQGGKRVSCSWSPPNLLSLYCSTATKQRQVLLFVVIKVKCTPCSHDGSSCRSFIRWSIPPAQCRMWTPGMDGEPSFSINKIMRLRLHLFVFRVNFDTWKIIWWEEEGDPGAGLACERATCHILDPHC